MICNTFQRLGGLAALVAGVMISGVFPSGTPVVAGVINGDTFDVAVTGFTNTQVGAFLAGPATIPFGTPTNIGAAGLPVPPFENVIVTSSQTLLEPERWEIVVDFSTENGLSIVFPGVNLGGEPLTAIQFEVGTNNAGTNAIDFDAPFRIASQQATVTDFAGTTRAADILDTQETATALAEITLELDAIDLADLDLVSTTATYVVQSDVDLGSFGQASRSHTGELLRREVRFFQFQLLSDVVGVNSLVIDTLGTVLGPNNDTEMALYDAGGNLVATADDIDTAGGNFLSALVFGNDVGAPVPATFPTLPAGQYTVAVGGFDTVFSTTEVDAASNSLSTGDITINVTATLIPEPGTIVLLLIGLAGLLPMLRRR